MNSTEVRYHRRRLADVAQAMRLARTQVSREQQPRARLAQHQQRRLETVVRHAAAHSPFYRRWLTETGALGKQPINLAHLPILTMPLLMDCVRAYATVGEMCDALREVWGEYEEFPII